MTRALRLSCSPPSLVLLALLAAPPAPAQSGFEWDYPDGLGVRYLLYGRIERKEISAKNSSPELRAMFLPKAKSDWVRIKGTELAWGVHVYEFRGEDGMQSFLQERDPRRTFREFRVEGQPIAGKGPERRYWEFIDRWRPFVEVLDRPQPGGPYRYAVSPELAVRFLADKDMEYVDPFVATDGDNCFARLHPAAKDWLRIDGVPGPVAWMIRVHVFPDMPRERSSSGRDHLVESFAKFVDEHDTGRKKYAREVTVRDQAVTGESYRLWRWLDRRTDGSATTTPCFHNVAAVYQVGGREVVLLGFSPANAPEPVPEPMARLEKMVTSLEPWTGKAKEPGFAYYNLASSCRIGDREVGMVVYLPIGTEPKPDRKLFDIARRMVHSLEPKGDKR